MPNERLCILEHRFQQLNRFRGSRASARDTSGKARAVTHVRVEALGEEADETRDFTRVPVEQQAQGGHRHAPDIVAHVGDCEVKAPPDRAVVSRAAVRERGGPHAGTPDHGVLVTNELLDERLSGLETRGRQTIACMIW